MIPKKIHYCWFGRKELSKLNKQCINSWKKYCPDYDIVLWNEDNFDLNCCDYVKEAAKAKKWAFVSDYARFKILYENGGFYFDTDVEILKPIDQLINLHAFMACELDPSYDYSKSTKKITIAPGLGMGAEPNNATIKLLLDGYLLRHFEISKNNYDLKTIVDYTTDFLMQKGLIETSNIQKVSGIQIFPKKFFNPYDFETGKIILSKSTYSIHHYVASWTSYRNKINTKIYYILKNLKTFFH